MNETLKLGIIALVKSAITGKKQDLPPNFDMVEIEDIVKKHQIIPLIYYGALNCGIDSETPAMSRMFNLVCQCMLINQRQMAAIKRISNVFEENGIDYMLLKGTLLKSIYPKAEMRNMGDADILIKTKQYDKIRPLLEEMGYKEHTESDHEYIWTKPELFLELHKRLIPSYNKDYYAYYGDGWKLALPCEDAPHRFKMSNENHMIYLFTHFSKHYRDGGIGIRHLIDLYVYRKANSNLDEEYIKDELRKLGLYDFYINVINTILVWFDDAKPDPKTTLITEVIFNSGVYGQRSKKAIAQTVRASKRAKLFKNAKINRFLQMIFPKIDSMKLRYKFLRKFPFLLPLAWMIRIFNIIFLKTNRAKSFYNDMRNMKSQDVTDYQQALNFVGLDFNFKE